MNLLSNKKCLVWGGVALLLLSSCLLLWVSGVSVCELVLFMPILVNAVWWWVQRPMLNRRGAYAVNLGLMAVGVSGMLFLPQEWAYLRLASYELAFFAFCGAMVMLASEGVNMPECRRLAVEAALPAREVDGTACPCSLTAQQVVDTLYAHTDAAPGKAEGSVAGYYEGADHEWDCYVKPLSADDWLLHLWTPDTFYLRDRELATICRQHSIPLTGVRMGTRTNAFCLRLAGQLHIYPASAQESVALFLAFIQNITVDK